MYSFLKNKPTVDLRPHIRRICDLTTPNLPTTFEGRCDRRSNRTIPTLICPWENDLPVVDELSSCLTSDLSDRGVGLVLSQPYRSTSILLGYWTSPDDMREPWYFVGKIRRNQAIGGGFWAVGVELVAFANHEHPSSLIELKKVSRKLRPPLAANEWQLAAKQFQPH